MSSEKVVTKNLPLHVQENLCQYRLLAGRGRERCMTVTYALGVRCNTQLCNFSPPTLEGIFYVDFLKKIRLCDYN